jgi:L-asparaginase II
MPPFLGPGAVRTLVSESRVEVTRGGTIESTHRVHGAVADASGSIISSFGDPNFVTFFRSSAKPFQALPLVEDETAEAFGLTDEELAVCCASHSGEPRHVGLVQGLLDRVGLDQDVLACGAQPPFNRKAADALVRSGSAPGRIHNNCSGKHAGMLLLATHHGWDIDGYEQLDHPVQLRMLDEVERWSQVPRGEIKTAVDGCGVVCFALSLSAMAAAYARFLAAARAEEPAARIIRAMTSHPHAVAGTDRLCTDVMAATDGRVWAKVGAEGVYGAGIVSSGLGLSLKVEDGGWRAGEVGLIALLQTLGAIDAKTHEKLIGRYGRVTNTLGAAVGSITGTLALESAAHG